MTSRHMPPPSAEPAESAVAAIRAVHRELHERVSVSIEVPARIRHSAYLLADEREETREAVRYTFDEVLRELGIPPDAVRWGERAGSAEKRFADGTRLRLIWELHTEFYSYTTIHLPPEHPEAGERFVELFTLPAFPRLGAKLVDVDLLVTEGLDLTREHRAFLLGGAIYGGKVVEGAAAVWTTFQVDDYGQGRYVVAAGTLTPGRVGRLARRLLDVENYYHLVLLPVPEYRRQVALLRDAELRITAHSEEIATELARRETDPEREHGWLVYLTRDLADLIQLTERMRYRFSAANSYFAILEERLHWLREQTGDGYQSLTEFLTNRVAPAVRSYRNFIERADALGAQLTTLGNMLRTRVNLTMERQNLKTIEAMNRRAALQLILQRTVEGLSVIVLTYYMTGLASYVFKAARPFLLFPGDPELWSALTIPLWLGLAFLFTRRIKRLVKEMEPRT